MRESDILYQNGRFWVMLAKRKTPSGKAYQAYEVYQDGITHSVRCATIGLGLGLERAKAEADKRAEVPA